MNHLTIFKQAKKNVDRAKRKAWEAYLRAIQSIANKHQVLIATGHMSDIWQVRSLDNDKGWLMEGSSSHPALRALARLDKEASEIQIGPSNGERFIPEPV